MTRPLEPDERRELTFQQRLDLGALVVVCRGASIGWKELEEMFQTDRTQLWRWAGLALSQVATKNSQVATTPVLKTG